MCGWLDICCWGFVDGWIVALENSSWWMVGYMVVVVVCGWLDSSG